MRRLKDKLGTRSVPTGEVELHDALGDALRPRASTGAAVRRWRALADDGDGERIAPGRRVHGPRHRAALVPRGGDLGVPPAGEGPPAVGLPLVREQLADLLCDIEAATALGFECSSTGRRDDATRLRRILIPAAKVRLCRLGVTAASTAVELHGGNGYCEDWGLTRQLRDAQCHPIWEGSENICSIDVLRAIRRGDAHEVALARVDDALAATSNEPAFLVSAIAAVGRARDQLAQRIADLMPRDGHRAEAAAGRLTALLADTVAAALLLLRGSPGDPRKALVAVRYVRGRVIRDDWDDRIVSFRVLGPPSGADVALAHAALR